MRKMTTDHTMWQTVNYVLWSRNIARTTLHNHMQCKLTEHLICDIQVAEDEASFPTVMTFGGEAPWLFVSKAEWTLVAEVDDGPVPSRVSSRSIMRDTAAIPALTSLLTSEPRFDIVFFCVNHLSFHPRVLFVIESLYLVWQRWWTLKLIVLQTSKEV